MAQGLKVGSLYLSSGGPTLITSMRRPDCGAARSHQNGYLNTFDSIRKPTRLQSVLEIASVTAS